MTTVRAESLAEIVDAVRESPTIRISGLDSAAIWRRPLSVSATRLEIGYRGVVEHDVSDQVVVVRAGTPLAELQAALAERGQCIPVGIQDGPIGSEVLCSRGSIGGQVALNLPHGLESACGNWRDWVLGLTLVRSDGEVAKCGSKAVKSVAGYDLAKLLVGSRGTLMVIAEVILRTYPIKALERSELVPLRDWSGSGVAQRLLRSDFDQAAEMAQDRLLRYNSHTSTLYLSARTRDEIRRFDADWMMGWGLGADNLAIEDETRKKLMITAKSRLDAACKFNLGEFFEDSGSIRGGEEILG